MLCVVVILVLLGCIHLCFGKQSVWIADNITISSNLYRFTGKKTWQYNLTIDSSGPIYNSTEGHFRLNVTLVLDDSNEMAFSSTDCISIVSSGPQVAAALKDSQLLLFPGSNVVDEIRQLNLRSLLHIDVKRFYNSLGSTSHALTAFRMGLIALNSRTYSMNVTNVRVDWAESNCAIPMTYGNWNDSSRWENGTVPSAEDDVFLPVNTGVVLIHGNVSVSSLNMTGGLILNNATKCPPGWSTDPLGQQGSKCYKLFSTPLPFHEAEAMCSDRVGVGSDGRHLVHIRDAAEMTSVLRTCRGLKGSAVEEQGCWIGLQDAASSGTFSWISPSAVGLPASRPELYGDGTSYTAQPDDSRSARGLYMDWRWGEWNNHSLSEGAPSAPRAGGERCAHLVPWQEDPLILEQGSWNDNSCQVRKPFVCQTFAATFRYAVNVQGSVHVNGGALEGGLLVSGGSSGSSSSVILMRVSRGGSLVLSSATPHVVIGSVLLEDGASLVLEAAQVQLLSNAFIGELDSLVSNTNSSSTAAETATAGGAAGPSNLITSATGFEFDPRTRTVVEKELATSGGAGDGVVDPNDVLLMMQPQVLVGPNTTVFVSPYCPEGTDGGYFGLLTPHRSGTVSASASPDALMCDETASNATINARVYARGAIRVGAGTVVILPQTSDMSEATVELSVPGAALVFAGYSARLSVYDSFALRVAHRGPVLGEYTGDYDQDQLNQHQGINLGVYRLRATQHTNPYSDTAVSNVTRCITYNATAAEVKDALDALPLVQSRGLVTVRRYGDGQSPDFLFGYTYRIETDSARTANFDLGPLDIDIDCYGIEGCGCSETMVPRVNVRGLAECPRSSSGNYSAVDPDACVITPALSVERVTRLSHTRVSGAGRLSMEGGVHRLPPRSNATIAVSAGSAVVAADLIDWYGLSVSGDGRLVAAGTGWIAWDSSYLLYSAEWTTARGLVSVLNAAPPFNMFVEFFSLDGFGSVLSACPQSNMTWNSGIWGGGIIGGRSTLYITGSMLAVDDNKSLRNGMTLWITDTATMEWTSGNISLANGADIIVEGNFTIDSATSGTEIFVGMAQLLEVDDGDEIGRLLLEQSPGRNFHSYYGDELPSELRGGWYQNPICGEQCLSTNHLVVRGSGIVDITSSSYVTFSLPLDLIGESRVNIGNDVRKTLASGGICGNDVVIDIGSGTTLTLSGGQMLMKASCTIQGEGDLVVSAGSHDLAFKIDARITILGGTMVWPESRGTDGTITFNGGLIMQNSGELQVRTFSTTVLVNQEVVLKDQCIIQFPLLGIAAQASPFDEPDAPDPSPRGNFTATGTMRFVGGTLRGKADFNALSELFLEGDTKFIQSLAKLVNKGHCEWGDGDMVMQDNGDFLNLGTVQMAIGDSQFFSNALYKGTELPVESGGDVFALEYHSWDTDNGGLDYTEYVRQRTEFVSRAPEGWTPEDQF